MNNNQFSYADCTINTQGRSHYLFHAPNRYIENSHSIKICTLKSSLLIVCLFKNSLNKSIRQ